MKGPKTRDLASLLDEGERRLERGDAQGALEAARKAVRLAPDDARSLGLSAASLAGLGRTEEARQAYERAVAAGGDDPFLLAEAASFLVDGTGEEPSTADLEAALELARKGSRLAREEGSALSGELALVEGRALAALGDPRAALARLADARVALPEDAEVAVEYALALFELCRFEDALKGIDDALRMAPDDAFAHQSRGRVAERLGRRAEARRSFERAHALAPGEFPTPLSLSAEEFDGAVEDAVASLPEAVRRYLSNVAITVEDFPSPEELLASDPPLSPSILGIFRGAPLQEKRSQDPWSHFPSSITLYQRNLETLVRDEEELLEEIGVTLLHEVGHFLGLDEEELAERGLG